MSEVLLLDRVYSAPLLDDAVREAQRLGFFLTDVRTDRIFKRRREASLEDSTTEAVLIYLEKNTSGQGAVIHGSESMGYGIFNYRILL